MAAAQEGGNMSIASRIPLSPTGSRGWFRISPFGSSTIRAVKKEQKGYLWDWSTVKEPGKRFENFVACQLLKYCHYMEDAEGYPMELRYIRDTDKREVDFVVLQDNKPKFAVESKLKYSSTPPSIAYFAKRLKIPAYYLVHTGKKDFEHATIPLRVLPVHKFTREQNLP